VNAGYHGGYAGHVLLWREEHVVSPTSNPRPPPPPPPPPPLPPPPPPHPPPPPPPWKTGMERNPIDQPPIPPRPHRLGWRETPRETITTAPYRRYLDGTMGRVDLIWNKVRCDDNDEVLQEVSNE